MKAALIVTMLCIFFGQFVEAKDKEKDSPIIIDMMLASPTDDPEPYLIQYIQGKEKLDVNKIQVSGSPDTPKIYYTAYKTESNGQCRNLWLVRISVSKEMAQGYARVVPCDKAEKEKLLQPDGTITYSTHLWPHDPKHHDEK